MRRKNSKQKRQLLLGGFFFALFSILIFVSVSQLDVIREFFGRARFDKANIMVDTKAIIGPLPRPWRNLAQGGEDHAWRIQPIQSQVAALNPEYIRLDHIYDFYDVVQGSPGNLQFDFSKLDLVLDDILATGAKPYIALSYMPPAITSGDIVDPPVNWADWQVTVERTIQHISGTRGIEDVYYEVWNEPDLFGDWKYYGDRNYLTMYSYAAQGAANTSGTKPFKFGGPGITALYKNWFNALLQHAVDNNLRLDFFSWHRYTTDVNRYKQDMIEARNWLRAFPMLEPTLEFHITEWGLDSENNPGYDNNIAAAQTVAGAIEMVGIVERAFVFEIQDGKDPEGQSHWGRWGMLTHGSAGNQSKPRYHAMKLLDSLGKQRVQVLGKGSFVKALAARSQEGNTEVMLVNFDPAHRHSETVPVTFDRIEPGSYTILKQYLSGQEISEEVATTEAKLQTEVPLKPNDMVKVELQKIK